MGAALALPAWSARGGQQTDAFPLKGAGAAPEVGGVVHGGRPHGAGPGRGNAAALPLAHPRDTAAQKLTGEILINTGLCVNPPLPRPGTLINQRVVNYRRGLPSKAARSWLMNFHHH